MDIGRYLRGKMFEKGKGREEGRERDMEGEGESKKGKIRTRPIT